MRNLLGRDCREQVEWPVTASTAASRSRFEGVLRWSVGCLYMV